MGDDAPQLDRRRDLFAGDLHALLAQRFEQRLRVGEVVTSRRRQRGRLEHGQEFGQPVVPERAVRGRERSLLADDHGRGRQQLDGVES